MLTQARIDFFKSCNDVLVDSLGNVTALVGRNGVGKSNILRAIAWAARLATGLPSNNERVHLLTEFGRVELEFKLDGALYCYSVDIILDKGRGERRIAVQHEKLELITAKGSHRLAYKDESGVYVRGKKGLVSFLTDPSFAMLPAIARLPATDEISTDVYGEIARFLSQIRYYPLNEPNFEIALGYRGLIAGDAFMEWLQSDAPDSNSQQDAMMRVLAMSLFEPEQYEEFRLLIGRETLNLVDEIKILSYAGPEEHKPVSFRGKKLAQFYSVSFGFVDMGTHHGSILGFDDLSHGTRRVIDLLAAMLYDKSSVMLLEHPEDAVHIGLLKKIMGLLDEYSESSKIQIILATHSRTIMNALHLTQLRFVSAENGITQVRRLKGNGLRAAVRYIANEGSEGGSVADFVEVLADTV